LLNKVKSIQRQRRKILFYSFQALHRQLK
jgi:hypothetical protein